MSERRTTTFRELVATGTLEIGDGYRAKLEELGGTGPIFLRAGLLSDHGIDWTGAERFREELAQQVNSKLGRAGDTVITTKGNSVGRAGYIPENAPSFVYSPHLSYWRSLDPSQLSTGFLRYWSRSPEFTAQLQAMAGSTDMAPYLSLVDQRRLQISIPSIGIQRAIAAVLGALDDKIAVNDRACTIIRELMATYYKMSIRENAIIASVADSARFHNNLRKPLSSRQRTEFKGPYPYYGATSIIDHVADYKFDGDYVLVGEDGSVITSDGYPVVQHPKGKFWVSNHAHVLTGSRVSNIVLELALNQASVGSLVTGAVQPKLSMGNLKRLMLELPGAHDEQLLDERLNALLQCERSRAAEALALVELRDTLLPRLMSGEIRVRDAEKAVEEVM